MPLSLLPARGDPSAPEAVVVELAGEVKQSLAKPLVRLAAV
ncbi:MAG TPA: hypothetical protein VIR15_14345 [Intrasporangium sp.]